MPNSPMITAAAAAQPPRQEAAKAHEKRTEHQLQKKHTQERERRRRERERRELEREPGGLEVEARAWTVHTNATAPEAAGVIHTDFQRGFIAAEVTAYKDFVALGGEQGAKAAGKMRLEGRDYVVQDGDVITIKV